MGFIYRHQRGIGYFTYILLGCASENILMISMPILSVCSIVIYQTSSSVRYMKLANAIHLQYCWKVFRVLGDLSKPYPKKGISLFYRMLF